jgi:hypothetical protein
MERAVVVHLPTYENLRLTWLRVECASPHSALGRAEQADSNTCWKLAYTGGVFEAGHPGQA